MPMTSLRPALALLLLGSMVLWLGGCAHEPPAVPSGPAPAIQLGPQLDLLRFSTTHDKITTLLDSQGTAHVFVAAASTREVNHVEVSPNGEIQSELVVSERSPSSISAAFDHAGRLHLLMDDVHVVRETSGWTMDTDTPWQAAGIEVRRPRLIQGRDGLVWSFLVKGKEVGAAGRWDWYIFGGAYAAIVVPWHSDSEKLVIVPPAGAAKPIWYVLDPQDNRDARNFLWAEDDHGSLYVVYDSVRTAIVMDAQPRYAQIELDAVPAEEGPLPAGSSARGTRYYPVSGKPLLSLQPFIVDLSRAAVAVDPASGTLLLVYEHHPALEFGHGNWSLPLRLPLSRFWEPRLAAAGGGAFHLMTVSEEGVVYLLYTQDGWSAPVEVGQAKVAGVFGSIWDALGIASAGHNRAFLVWPVEGGIVGRWIQGATEIEATPRKDLVTLAPGVAIPKSLLDFANGKATLVTPAWTSGLEEAAAAGSHSHLVQQLHDSGQWESLALYVLSDNYGDDLRWYFLGRAAEGMALCDAAEVYYGLSRERSEKLVTRCKSIGSGPCTDLHLPQDLEERFRAIRNMRDAGKCVIPYMDQLRRSSRR